MVLRFRNITATVEDPVEQWGVEGILAAIERGGATHWRRIIEAVEADPSGEVVDSLGEALACAERSGQRALLARVLEAMPRK